MFSRCPWILGHRNRARLDNKRRSQRQAFQEVASSTPYKEKDFLVRRTLGRDMVKRHDMPEICADAAFPIGHGLLLV